MTISEFVKFADAVTGSKKSLDKAQLEVAEIEEEFGVVMKESEKINAQLAEKNSKMREETKKSVETFKKETSSYENLPEWLEINQSTFDDKDVGFIAVLRDDSLSPLDVANSLATLRPMIFTRYLSEATPQGKDPNSAFSKLRTEYNDLLKEKEKFSIKINEMNGRKAQCESRKARQEGGFISQKNALVKDLTFGDLKGLEQFYELNILQDLIAAKASSEGGAGGALPPSSNPNSNPAVPA
jgi:hypothetical protein